MRRIVLLVLVLLFLSLVVAAQFQTSSPGAAIESAARGSAKKVDGADEAYNGRYGVDVLTPTNGVNIGPYLETVTKNVQRNWFRFIPNSARGPERRGPWSRKPKLAQGIVSIEFLIGRDGYIKDLHVADGSGDAELDQAALSGVSASVPFPHLPEKFKSETLRLRFHFYYNPSHHPREGS
jgi:TonB family protein